MKFWKLTLFSFICGIMGGLIKFMCQQNWIGFSIASGCILGITCAFALLSFDSIKNFFMGKKND